MDVALLSLRSTRRAGRPCRSALISTARTGRDLAPNAESLESRALLAAVITEFNSFPPASPDLGTNPATIARAPNGDLWYVARGSNRIVKFSTTAPQVSPATSEAPQSLVVHPTTGMIWYTAQNANRIGRFDPRTNTIQEFTIPTASSFPTGITLGSDGNLWFTEQNANKIGRFNPANNSFFEYNIPTPNGSPFSIMTGPDGNLWFTLYNTSRIGRIVPSTGQITEFPTPTVRSGPLGLATGTDGKIWFTQYNADKIGRLDALTGAIQEFALPRPSNVPGTVIVTGPQGIAAAPNGVMYFTGAISSKIGRITSTGAVREFATPTRDSRPTSIIFGTDGAMWFTQYNVKKIGRLVYTPSSSNADFDGDGKTELGVFRPATAQWLARLSGGGVLRDPATNNIPVFGATNLVDIPLSADFDGDGKADLGVYRPSTSEWLVRLSGGGVLREPNSAQTPRFGIGNLVDLPVPADYDGDGKADIAVFRTTTAQWFIIKSSNGQILLDPATGRPPQFGASNLVDLPIPGDYDGDGKADFAVFRPATAQWLVRLSGGGILRDPATNTIPVFGGPNFMDIPLAGDFDGDGKTDLGVFRPATAQWLVRLSGGGVLQDPATNTIPRFGATNFADLPLPSPIAALVKLGLTGTFGGGSRSGGLASQMSAPAVTVPLAAAVSEPVPDVLAAIRAARRLRT